MGQLDHKPEGTSTDVVYQNESSSVGAREQEYDGFYLMGRIN
jgi:hypothetical protein